MKLVWTYRKSKSMGHTIYKNGEAFALFQSNFRISVGTLRLIVRLLNQHEKNKIVNNPPPLEIALKEFRKKFKR